MSGNKKRILESFTKQADSYSESTIIVAEETRHRYVEFVNPNPNDKVLDVATGPGFLAILFAEKAADVIGIDITPAMLQRAEKNRLKKNLKNITFKEGDAESLPFPDETFNIVTCGSAFHHFSNPERILKEMIRVTRQKGKVTLSDTITSENIDQAILHNKLEQWRDPSHTRNIPFSELVNMFKKVGLKDIRTSTYETPRELAEWFAISKTPIEVAEHVKKAFIESIPNDATGLKVHLQGKHVCFTHTSAWIMGIKT